MRKLSEEVTTGFWRTAILQHAHILCWRSHPHHGTPTSGCAEADSAGTNPPSLESNRAFLLQPVLLNLAIFALVLVLETQIQVTRHSLEIPASELSYMYRFMAIREQLLFNCVGRGTVIF